MQKTFFLRRLSNLLRQGRYLICAQGGNRTHTSFRTTDFKSVLATITAPGHLQTCNVTFWAYQVNIILRVKASFLGISNLDSKSFL